MGSNPIGGADGIEIRARYANRPSGQAQTLVIVGSNPTRAIMIGCIARCVGWALASPGGRNHPPSRAWRFDSVPTHSLILNGPFGYRQATWFSARRGGFDSLTGHGSVRKPLAGWRNW